MTLSIFYKHNLELIKLFAIPVTTSLVTVYLAMWRFRSDRWWELKVETYNKIIKALHKIKYNVDFEYLEYMKTLEPPFTYLQEENFKEWEKSINNIKEQRKSTSYQEQVKKIKTEHYKAVDYLLEAIDIGSFIISKQAVRELDEFLKKLQTPYQDYEEIHYYLSDKQDETLNCLLKFKQIAKIDIKTNSKILKSANLIYRKLQLRLKGASSHKTKN